MTARLSSSQPDFDTALAAFLASRRTGVAARVDGPVREIIQDVQTRGAAAVSYTHLTLPTIYSV